MERATLSDKLVRQRIATATTGLDTGFRVAVPGVKGPTGQGVGILVLGTFGQAVGSQAAMYTLATDGSTEPIGRVANEVPDGGYYVMLTGMRPSKTPTVRPRNEELLSSATTFADSELFAETAKVMASLKLHPEEVQAVGCFGAKCKYLELNGISCENAKAALDRVEKTGTDSGARNMETADRLCFYASYGEKRSGQADVICRNKANP